MLLENDILSSLNYIQEIVLFFDKTGKVLYSNVRAQELLEFEDLTKDCRITEIFPALFQEKAGTLEMAHDVCGDLFLMEAYRKNRTYFPVRGRIVPHESRPDVYILMGIDATREELLSRKNEKSEQAVEDALKVRSEFIANITHELRTPVNGILGNTQQLVLIETDKEKQKILSLIERGCADMNSIINNILDFSKLEAGKFTLEPREFCLRDCIDYVRSVHKNKTAEKGLDFVVNVASDIPETVVGDELRLVQVLNNLLSNACKFTSVGRIMLEVVKTAQLQNRVQLFFLVIDTGIGIDKAGMDKLFESFSQVDATISRRFGGTGLGLNIAKQLVELMDGTINVESEVGKGSTFSFHIWMDVPNTQENAKAMAIQPKAMPETMLTFAPEPNQIWKFGSKENMAELEKKMSKLILSVEMENIEKAENFLEAIRKLLENSPKEIKGAGLKLKMAVQKGDYEKTIEAYDSLKQKLETYGRS